ncbi:hypothetical protein, partial [Micromonospora wenchangensis]|uniref:hypothetical protein n=1 Tax=Micromonospora wenchangensis TaxID=1185415 RepID=UPI003438C7B6
MTRPGFTIRRHRARPAPATVLVAAGAACCLAADSTTALAQLVAQPESGIDRRALTALSMVDLAA